MSSDAQGEAELTRTLDAAAATRLTRLARLPKAKLGRAMAEHVYAVYYDTPERDLKREGLSLKLTHSGQGRVQTVAVNGEESAAERVIDFARINGAQPDITHILQDDVRERVTRATRGAALAPVFETRVLRLTRDIRTDDGDVLSLAIDQGEMQANRQSAPISELTLALKSGSAARLDDIALALGLEGDSPAPRVDRGYTLSGPPEGLAPRKAGALELKKKATVGEVLSASLAHVRAHLGANVRAVLEGRDVEGVHQMRVGLRRLRTVCAAFAPTGAGEALEVLDTKARELGRTLGRARDLDVFLTETFPAAATDLAAEEAALTPLLHTARAAQADAWTHVIAALQDPAFDRFLAEIDLLAARGDWPKAKRKSAALGAPAKPFGAKRLELAFDSSEDLARKLKRLSESKRHTLRKRLKHLRYTGELFESLFSAKAAKHTLKRLSRLQETFGALNDVAVAGDLGEAIARELETRGETVAAERVRHGVALVVAWHRPRAEALFAEARKRWRTFSAGPLFWD